MSVDVDLVGKIISDKRRRLTDLFQNYKSSGMYNGKVVLFRTTQNLIKYDATEYWGLEEVSKPNNIIT